MRAPVVVFIALLGSVFPLLCPGLTISCHRKAHSPASSARSSNPAASSSAVSSEAPNSPRSTDGPPVAVRAPETTLPYLQPTPLYFNTLPTSEATALKKKDLLQTFTDRTGHVTTITNHRAFPPGAEASLIAALSAFHTRFTYTRHAGTMDHNTQAKTASASVPRPTITAPPNAWNRRRETVDSLFPDGGSITVTDPVITVDYGLGDVLPDTSTITTVTAQSTSDFPVPQPYKYRDVPKHYTLSTKKTATVQPPSISDVFPLPSDTSLSPRGPPLCWEEQYLDGKKVWMWNCAEEPDGQDCWGERNRDGKTVWVRECPGQPSVIDESSGGSKGCKKGCKKGTSAGSKASGSLTRGLLPCLYVLFVLAFTH
ncbi:hypothetical protein V8F33_009760 [Rhypophila sp. PSN 637]